MAVLNAVAELKQNSHGAVFDTIIVDTFRLLNVVSPPSDLMQQFEDASLPLFQASLDLIRITTNLRQTRDLLLPKLVSGKVDVERIDIEIGE